MFDFKFDWDNSLNVDIQIIDEQHQELFRIGRKIEQSILTGCIHLNERDLLNLLCEVREYVTYHFYEEEKLIQELKPHLLENHKNQHDAFVKWVNSINCIKLVQDPVDSLKELKEALKKWLFEHIVVEDKKVFCEK